MAVKTKDDIMAALSAKFGDDSSDDVIAIMEDVADTFSDYENRYGGEDWKKKYEDNDAEWRKRYKERFLSAEDVKEAQEEQVQEDTEKRSFDELFEDREG